MKKKFYTPPCTRSKGVLLEAAICVVSNEKAKEQENSPLVIKYEEINNDQFNGGAGITFD